MIVHCNRWLLGFAAAYLALLPTNTATFARSLAYGGAAVFAVIVFALAACNRHTRVPLSGPLVLIPLAVWSLWSIASLAWSVKPEYTWAQLQREVLDSLLTMLIFYVAAADARSFRVLTATSLVSFSTLALLATAMDLTKAGWDPALYHNGVGPYSTWLVLVAPFLFALIAPPPAGLGNGRSSLVAGLVMLGLLVWTARLTDNRAVWIALTAVFGVASLTAALRWPQTFTRTPWRWSAPMIALILVLALAFADALTERAESQFPPDTSVARTIEHDPRLALWNRTIEKIRERPWQGYGFGRLILADELAKELGDPLLAHGHNVFVGQWLQTGVLGIVSFTALLLALAWRYASFVRSRDDPLAFVGVVGLSLVAGFVMKNLTDDFLFRSNAKEFWAFSAILLGYGMRRATVLAAGGVPTQARLPTM
jgi:O-antigen ligase